MENTKRTTEETGKRKDLKRTCLETKVDLRACNSTG